MKKNSDILSLDEILNQKQTPNFLQAKGKITANFLNEPKQQSNTLVKVNAVIEKAQKVNQNRAKEMKETQQHLDNFKQYIELSKFAKTVSKKAELLEQQSKKIAKTKQKQATIKEKQKQRRMKGQSSIATWKSESEMKLRQQFD